MAVFRLIPNGVKKFHFDGNQSAFRMLGYGVIAIQSPSSMPNILAIMCVAVWAYLICGRGWFWAAAIRGSTSPPVPGTWPHVVAIMPARNEAELIAASVGSLLRQSYPGEFSIIVVDDDSADETAAIAASADSRITVISSRGLPTGWTGKLWALKQGVAAAERMGPDYLLLTDADIVHATDTLSWLVARASAGGFILTSLMARLRCVSLSECSHVPAFVYFFQLLFPFAWVNRPEYRTAAAAGGCMLIRTDALRSAGGIDSVRDALIDDCSLATKLKAVGPIWLGLTERICSIRAYENFAAIKAMISRSAYAQLRYSPSLLVATTVSMALTFLAAPLLAIFASGLAQDFGAAAWLAMTVSFQPMLRFYRLSPFWGLALPAIALAFMYYTLASAYDHARGRNGQWKGRVHVSAAGLS